MANSVDLDETALTSEFTVFAQVLVLVCQAERIKVLNKIVADDNSTVIILKYWDTLFTYHTCPKTF